MTIALGAGTKPLRTRATMRSAFLNSRPELNLSCQGSGHAADADDCRMVQLGIRRPAGLPLGAPGARAQAETLAGASRSVLWQGCSDETSCVRQR